MSQSFTSGGQSIEASASTSVLPMNIQDWFPLGWTGWISLQSKGLSKVSYLSRGGKSRLIADMALLLESVYLEKRVRTRIGLGVKIL